MQFRIFATGCPDKILAYKYPWIGEYKSLQVKNNHLYIAVNDFAELKELFDKSNHRLIISFSPNPSIEIYDHHK